MALPKVIYIMGPPGAGKGTQAELLAQKIGYHQFSTGDAFRSISRQDTELGRKVKKAIDNGYLMPPEMAAEVVIEAVQKHVVKGSGLVFDGTPRTEREAQLVDNFFTEQQYGRPLAIFLSVGRQEMMERNSKRRFCLDIQNDFPVVTLQDEQKCEELGGRIGVRPDDEPEKFETRWQEYQTQTYPVVKKYQAEGILKEVDGKASVEEVHRQVMEVINSFGR